MNIKTKTISLNDKLNDILADIPVALKYYLYFFLIALILFAFWVPGNDFDSMTSYIARIKLEEFGDLRQVGTLELQYLFPKFFDYLHKPFLKLGFFTTLPNLVLLFTFMLLIIQFFPKKIALCALSLIFATHPILILVSSMKNDVALGIFAFITWFAISYLENSKWYLSICLILISCLIGIKWHGLFLALFFGVYLLYRLIKTHKPSKTSWIILIIGLPLLFYTSSAKTYIDNYLIDGSICPVPYWLQLQSKTGFKVFFLSLYHFFTTTLIETFDLPLGLLDQFIFHGKIWHFITDTLHSGKQYYYTTVHSSNYTSFGIILLISLAMSCYVYFKKSKFSLEVRIAALISLLYTITTLYYCPYAAAVNRYLITSYILSLIPFATVLASIRFNTTWKTIFCIYLACITTHVLLGNQDRRIIKLKLWSPGPPETVYHLNTIFQYGYRNKLYFHIWSGHLEIYNFMKKNIHKTDSLLFINQHQGGSVPFIYPFIKDRDAMNTGLINTRLNQTADFTSKKWKYLFVFQGEITAPNYEKIKSLGQNDISIYKLIRKDV